MTLKDRYRHENKFIISYAQKTAIENSIAGVLQKDSHLKGESYNIRSIYFDDYDHSCFYENENGVDPREKFRIRIYDGSSRVIRLELKKKQKLMTQKLQCALTREQVDQILNGDFLDHFGELNPLLRKFELQRMCRMLHPDVIVEYDRVPYVYDLGNVRITFDTNISSSKDFEHFFCRDISKRPIMMTDMLVLEVKYDEYLPNYIEDLLSVETEQRTSFSKYYMCKHFLIQEYGL